MSRNLPLSWPGGFIVILGLTLAALSSPACAEEVWDPMTATLLQGRTVNNTVPFTDTFAPNGLWATDQGVVLVSDQGGGTWSVENRSSGLPPGMVKDIARSPDGNPSTFYAATTMGIYRTTDKGLTWLPANQGFSQTPISNSFANAGNYLFVNDWISGNHVYRIDGTTTSPTWTQMAPLLDGPHGAPFIGKLGSSTAPGGAPLVFAGTSGGGLQYTTDFGNSWQPSGLYYGDVGYVDSFGGDPLAPGTWFAGNGDADNPSSPTFQNWLFVTQNGGGTWTEPFGPNDMLFPVTDIHVWQPPPPPESVPAGFSPAFIGTAGGKVWKSLDGGATWADISEGLPAEDQIKALCQFGDYLIAGTVDQGIFRLLISTCSVNCNPASSPTSGAAPLQVSFAANLQAPGCGGGPLFSWAFGDGMSSSEMNPVHTYDAPGTYPWSFTATVDGITCSGMGTVTVSSSAGSLQGSVFVGSPSHSVLLGGPAVLSMTARLTDPTGAPVASGPVTAGSFFFEDLQPGTYKLLVDLSYFDTIPNDASLAAFGCPHPSGFGIAKPVTSMPVSVQILPGPNSAEVRFPPPLVLLHGAPGCYQKWYRDNPSDPDYLAYWDNAARGAGFLSFTPSYSWSGDGVSWTRMADQVADQLASDLLGLSQPLRGATGAVPPAALLGFDAGGLVARALTSGPRREDPAVNALQGIFLLGTPNSGTDLLFGGATNALTATNFIVRRFNEVFPDFGSKTASVYALAGNDGWWRLTNSDGRVSIYSAFNIARLSCGDLSTSLQACTPYTAISFPSGQGHIHPYAHGQLGAPASKVDILDGVVLPLLSATVGPGTPESPAGTYIWGTTTRTSGSAQGSVQSRAPSVAEYPFRISATDGLGVVAYTTEGSASFELLSPARVIVARGESTSTDDGGWQTSSLNPAPGEWVLRVTPGAEGATFQAVLIEDSLFGIRAYTDREAYRPGATVLFRLDADRENAPEALYSSAEALIYDPATGEPFAPVTLFDDGNHMDGEAGDGLFGNTATAPSSSGSYPVEFRAHGSYAGREFTRIAKERLNVLPLRVTRDPIFTGSFSDEPVDLDGDGLYDAVRMTAAVSFPAPGSYICSGTLTDADGDFISQGTAFRDVASAGPSTFVLDLRTKGATCTQFQRPFEVADLSVLEGFQLVPLDRWDDPEKTAEYDGPSFGCQAGTAAPTAGAVRPDQAAQGRSLVAVVSGRNFKSGATPDFGAGIAVIRSVFLGPTALAAYITVDGSAQLGARTVTITNPGGASATLPGGFEVVGPSPPMVVLQTPADGTHVAGDVQCSAGASDETRVAKVEFLLDGSPVAEDAEFPFQCNWDSRSAPNGTHALSARATGASGLTRTSTPVSLTVENAGVPGDCDGSGTVTIGEVQKAINMFLGLTPPECGVNCSGSGTVSIGEVQKVINNFLGILTFC